jgi:glyoxylase-like metal-dependent hydrolase (beta-lactamase superfamily II)
VRELAPDLVLWSARHPEWHPGEFGAEVNSYAYRAGDEAVLIDPLVLEGDDATAAALDDFVSGRRASIIITITYHVRSAEALSRRYGATIHGHRAVAKRLGDGVPFEPFEPGDELPGGALPQRIGNPRRYETPLLVPSQSALVFGDAVVTAPGGELRVWEQVTSTPNRRDWYEQKFLPTLRPLLDLDFERVLTTHGEPIITNGREALRAALAEPPWWHRG